MSYDIHAGNVSSPQNPLRRRLALSFRNFEEMLAIRGVSLSGALSRSNLSAILITFMRFQMQCERLCTKSGLEGTFG